MNLGSIFLAALFVGISAADHYDYDYDYDVTLSDEKCNILRHLLDKVCPATLTTSTSTIPATTVAPSIVAFQPGVPITDPLTAPFDTTTTQQFPFGNTFTPTRNIQVTSLGVFDRMPSDGLFVSHNIGIFNDFMGMPTPNPNTPLASVNVPAGNPPAGSTFVADEVGGVGGTWFITLGTPITLVAGNKYFILIDNFASNPGNGDDYFLKGLANYNIGQDLNFDQAVRYSSSQAGLITDTNVGITTFAAGNVILGPNFEYE